MIFMEYTYIKNTRLTDSDELKASWVVRRGDGL